MAREARKIGISGNYYVVLRGEELFVTDEDKKMFSEILEKNFATGIVHAIYMSRGEIRLVVKVGEKGISMMMKPVTTSYARYFNKTHNREGRLFIGRFKSEPLESDEEVKTAIENIAAEDLKKNVGTQKKKKTVKTSAKKSKTTGTLKTAKKNGDTKSVDVKTDKVNNINEEVKEENTSEKSSSAPKNNLPSWLL